MNKIKTIRINSQVNCKVYFSITFHHILAHNCMQNSEGLLFLLYYSSARWIKFIILQIIFPGISFTFNILKKSKLSGIIIVEKETRKT